MNEKRPFSTLKEEETEGKKKKPIYAGLSLDGFPGGTVVKTFLPMQETLVRSLGQEGPLKKGTATHTSILA